MMGKYSYYYFFRTNLSMSNTLNVLFVLFTFMQISSIKRTFSVAASFMFIIFCLSFLRFLKYSKYFIVSDVFYGAWNSSSANFFANKHDYTFNKEWRQEVTSFQLQKETRCRRARSSCPEVFCKKGILRSFAKFTGKHLWQGWVKMPVDRRREIKKKKHPKAVPRKRNLDQNIKNINDSKSRICNYFFENIILGVQLYSTRFSGHHQSFFTPEFVAENLKAKKNQRERSLILQYSFTQKTSLILWISTLEIENHMLP